MIYPQFDYSPPLVTAAEQREILRRARIAEAMWRKQAYPNDKPTSFIALFSIAPVRLEAKK